MSIKLMSAVWCDARVSKHDLLTLLALADCANDEGICWPHIKTIADKCRCSVRSIQRSIKSLVDAGYLEVREREGSGLANVYHVILSPPDAGKVVTPVTQGGDAGVTGVVTPVTQGGDAGVTGVVTPVTQGGDAGVTQNLKEPSEEPVARARAHARHAEILDLFPDSINQDRIIEFIDHRKAKKSPLTAGAAKVMARELAKVEAAGLDPNRAIEIAMLKGWTGIMLDWIRREMGNGQSRGPVERNGRIEYGDALGGGPVYR